LAIQLVTSKHYEVGLLNVEDMRKK